MLLICSVILASILHIVNALYLFLLARNLVWLSTCTVSVRGGQVNKTNFSGKTKILIFHLINVLIQFICQ